jgi:hypothetical protein
MAEHWLYLPSIGFFLLAALLPETLAAAGARPEVEAIDLLGAAGAPILKRLVPTLLVVAVVVVVILVLR